MIGTVPLSTEPLPGWLIVAAEAGVSPPVEPRLQELPFDQLTWQNFEKLCYRLARAEADVECCRIYGEAGNDQQGIDLFARRAGREKWTVYQCKRVRDFGPALIEAAAREFLKGELVGQTECFILCTSESLRASNRWETVEKMRGELQHRGVEFKVWDSLELNSLLKDTPLLVADFFHKEWARAFCALLPDNLAQRLSAIDVRQFRKDCRVFYEQCFSQADAGWLASGAGGRSLPPLTQRFVGRDILEKRATGLIAIDDFSEQATVQLESNPARQSRRDRSQVSSRRQVPWGTEIRTALSDWLAHGGQFVLGGEPGAGKSTVLRFLALDLLSESPTLAAGAHVWADHLPVWVPFPLWTRRIAERGGAAVSLIDLLQEWFANYSNSHLWPLVERGLADERLLLLVDGLDEWRDESAARVALQLLHVFIGQRKTPAVLVGRPQGLATLGPFPAGYREAVLAPLNRAQQQTLVARLLEAHDESATQVDAFFRDLDQVPTLRSTAGVPLLLGLLLRQHLEHARLPVSRFRAGERMVEALLRDHPIRRQQAALLCATPLLAERELRETFAYVAWRMHTEKPEGLVEIETMRQWLVSFLEDEDSGLAYPRLDARRIADELLRHGEREFGVIVERAPRWCGFFHRTIQELLAADYLGTLERTKQLSILRERASEPHWHEVLLAWCHRRSAPDFAEIVATLEELTRLRDIAIQQRIATILAELATGDFAVPTNLGKRLARQTVETLWTCEWPNHRRQLLDLLLNGLHGSRAVRSIVQDAVRAWFPARLGASYRLSAQMARWPSSAELIEALLHTLHHEEESAQRAAAESLGFFSSSDSALADRLLHFATTSIRATTRACALEALARGRPDDSRTSEIAERERHSGSGELAITAIAIRIQKKLQTSDDLQKILRCAVSGPFHTDYYWRHDLTEALLSGWPRSEKVKSALIKSLACNRPREQNAIEHEIAFPVAIRGFSEDEDIALALAQFFQRHNAFISLEHYAKDWLPGNARWFAAHPVVSNAVEAYLFREAQNDDYRFAQAALLARTDRVKAHLLDRLGKSKAFGHWPAWALLKGWGIEDPDVATALRQILDTQPPSVTALADLIPQVFPDRGEARRRLLQYLDSEKADFPWFTLRGLLAIDGHLRSPDVLERCIRLMESASDWQRDSIRSYLIEYAAPDNRVRKIALAELDDHDGDLTSVAEGFGQDDEIRERLIGVVAPLPAELRAVIVDRLEALPAGDPFAREMLSQFDLEGNGDVKARAAVAYAKRERANGTLDLTLIDRLRSMLHAVGSDYEGRRQAALAALLELREFNAIREEFKECLQDGPSLFGESLRHRKATLSRQLAKHWTNLKSVLGDAAFVEFTYKNQPLSFANRFAEFVEEGCGASEWLATVLSTAEQNGISFGLLNYFSQTDPSSERLLKLCIDVVHGRVKTSLYGWADQIQTAGFVATQWGGNEKVLGQLTAGFIPIQLPEPVVIALTLGWAESKELADFHEAAVNEKRRVSYHLWHALFAVFSPPASFVRRLTRFALKRGGEESYIFRDTSHYYATRLQRDEEAKCALLAALERAKSPDVRVTLTWLLSRAASVWPPYHEWRSRELIQAGVNTSNQFGYNLATSNVEHLWTRLIEE